MGSGISTTAISNPNEPTEHFNSKQQIAQWEKLRNKSMLKFVNATKGKTVLSKEISDACSQASSSSKAHYLPLHTLTEIINEKWISVLNNTVKITEDQVLQLLQLLSCDCSISLEGSRVYCYKPIIDYLEPKVLNSEQPNPQEGSELQEDPPVQQHQEDNNISTPTKEQYYLASKAGSLSVIQSYLTTFPEAFVEKDDFNNTVLYYSCLCGHAAIVSTLISTYYKSIDNIPKDEKLRCHTNALNSQIKQILDGKTTSANTNPVITTEDDDDDLFSYSIMFQEEE